MFNYCPYSLILSHLDQHDLGGTSTFVTYKTERYVGIIKDNHKIQNNYKHSG